MFLLLNLSIDVALMVRCGKGAVFHGPYNFVNFVKHVSEGEYLQTQTEVDAAQEKGS